MASHFLNQIACQYCFQILTEELKENTDFDIKSRSLEGSISETSRNGKGIIDDILLPNGTILKTTVAM